MPAKYDLAAGDMFNRLTVVREVPKTNSERRWLCRCECDRLCEVNSYDLRKGKTKSCGCQQYGGTHGRSGTPEYAVWAGMIQRCTNPNKTEYRYYGGRGISVCSEWVNDFEAFYEHVGERPSPTHSLDRIDSDGDYEPGNVKWATPLEQWENRKIRRVSFDDYQSKTNATAIYPSDTEGEALVYLALGLGSEASEVCGKVKKTIRDNGYEVSAEIKSQIMDEMGDTLWYLSELANTLGVRLDVIATRNLNKLRDRAERGQLSGSGDNR